MPVSLVVICKNGNKLRILTKLFTKPKGCLEWISTISSLILLFLYLFNRIFDNFSGVPSLQYSFRWICLQPIEFIAYVVMISSIIIGGIRKIRTIGFTLKSSSNLIAGIIVLLISLLVSIFCYIWIPKMMNFARIPKSRIAEMELSLEKGGFDNERKALLSSIIASGKYQISGEIVSVFDKQGNKNKYIPTDTDKEIVLKTKEIYAMLPQFERVAYIWCIVLLLSVIIGLKTPIKGIK